MPKFLEDKLKAEAAAKGKTGREADRYIFGTMNNIGAMKGNQVTAKGERMQAKHERDMGVPKATSRASAGPGGGEPQPGRENRYGRLAHRGGRGGY